MPLIHEPTQQRSLETQEQILDAFEALLEDNFLDDITVRQIAKKAGITPATIYRRFKNKDALLTVLYERYEKLLEVWASHIWRSETLAQEKTPNERIRHIVNSHIEFYRENKSMIRTLYLKARTSDIDLESMGKAERKRIYADIFLPVLELFPEEDIDRYGSKIPFLILILISSINEKLLFSDQKPASLLALNNDHFADQLSRCLTGLLMNCAA